MIARLVVFRSNSKTRTKKKPVKIGPPLTKLPESTHMDSLDPDQARLKIGPDLDPNYLTLMES